MYSIMVSGGCQVAGRFQPNQHGHVPNSSASWFKFKPIICTGNLVECCCCSIQEGMQKSSDSGPSWAKCQVAGYKRKSVCTWFMFFKPSQTEARQFGSSQIGPPDQPWPTEPPGQLQDTVHVEATGDLAALVHLGDDGNAISWQRQDGQKMNDRPREMGWKHMKTITYGKVYHHKMDQSWISWYKWPKSVRTWEILDVDTKPRPHIPRCWQLQPSQPSVQSAPTSLATTRIGPRNWRDNTRMGRWVWHFVHSQLVGCHNRKEFWE